MIRPDIIVWVCCSITIALGIATIVFACLARKHSAEAQRLVKGIIKNQEALRDMQLRALAEMECPPEPQPTEGPQTQEKKP